MTTSPDATYAAETQRDATGSALEEMTCTRPKMTDAFLFSAVMTQHDDRCDVTIPDLGISFTADEPDRKAVGEAIDLARGEIQRRMVLSEAIPDPTSIHAKSGSKVVVIGFEVEFPSEEFFTVEDAMKMLGVSQPRVSFLIQGGKLNSIKVGRRHLIPRESLIAYMESPRIPGRPRKHPAQNVSPGQ